MKNNVMENIALSEIEMLELHRSREEWKGIHEKKKSGEVMTINEWMNVVAAVVPGLDVLRGRC